MVSQTPDSLPNLVNHLFDAVWEAQARWLKGQGMVPKRTIRYGHWCDGVVPTVFGTSGIELVQWPFDYYHTSLDSLERVDVATVARVGQLAGAFVHFLAWAQEDEAMWLLGEMSARAQSRISRAVQAVVADVCTGRQATSEALSWLRDRARYLADRESAHIGVATQLHGSPCVVERVDRFRDALEEYADAQLSDASLLFRRWARRGGGAEPSVAGDSRSSLRSRVPAGPDMQVLGTLMNIRTRAAMSEGQRRALVAIQAAYPDSDPGLPPLWIDGQRSVDDIARLVSQEAGKPQMGFVRCLFAFLEEHGFVRFKQRVT
jgi:hypothetical protein